MYCLQRSSSTAAYSAAARALGLQTSKLSRRISESRSSSRCACSSARHARVPVTDVGQAYYLHCAALEAEPLPLRTQSIARVRPQGLIRMSCPFR